MAGKRTYRTSQGKTVDLGALLLQNENTRAIDNRGKVVDSKVQQTKRQYNKQIGLVDELPATSRRAAAALVEDPVVQQEQPAPAKPRKSSAEKAATKAAKTSTKKTPAAKKTATKKDEPKIREVSPTVLDIEVEETVVPQEPIIETPVVEETAPVAPRGLADAIARARSIKQEQAKTPRQLAQEKAGVRKI